MLERELAKVRRERHEIRLQATRQQELQQELQLHSQMQLQQHQHGLHGAGLGRGGGVVGVGGRYALPLPQEGGKASAVVMKRRRRRWATRREGQRGGGAQQQGGRGWPSSTPRARRPTRTLVEECSRSSRVLL